MTAAAEVSPHCPDLLAYPSHRLSKQRTGSRGPAVPGAKTETHDNQGLAWKIPLQQHKTELEAILALCAWGATKWLLAVCFGGTGLEQEIRTSRPSTHSLLSAHPSTLHTLAPLFPPRLDFGASFK